MRLNKHSIIPIGVIALVAVGTTAVQANPTDRGSTASQHVSSPPATAVRHPAPSPVLDPAMPPVPPVYPVVDPAIPAVGPAAAPVRPAVAPSVRPAVAPSVRPAVAPPVRPAVAPSPVILSTTSPALDQRPAPVLRRGPAPVNLGAAGSFAILTKTGLTDVPGSSIIGDVGASPITGAAIGVGCPEVMGAIFTVDAAGPAPCRRTDAPALTTAVGDEEAAYTDAAGRGNPGFVNLGAGEIGGLTVSPGLYKWTTGVSLSRDVILSGGPRDVWIFQVSGTLTQASATRVRLTGGALARNVFWQTAGAVDIGTTAHFEGTILSQTMITVNTGALVTGRLLAQTQVALQKNSVTIAR